MKILVVVAHPDDEAFGVLPLLVHRIAQGDKVHVVTFTENGGRTGCEGAGCWAAKELAANAGYTIEQLCLEDQSLDTHPLQFLIDGLKECVEGFNPDLVLTHLADDLNRDHRIVNEVVKVVYRYGVTVAEFPVLSSSENLCSPWMPNAVEGIPEHAVEHAWALIEAFYTHECQPYPHPRSRTAYGCFYGHMGAFGKVAFACLFKVTKLRLFSD